MQGYEHLEMSLEHIKAKISELESQIKDLRITERALQSLDQEPPRPAKAAPEVRAAPVKAAPASKAKPGPKPKQKSAGLQPPASSFVNGFDNPQGMIYFNGWRFAAGSRFLVSPQRRVISLPPVEYDILGFLLKNANKIVTRDELALHIWGRPLGPSERTIDVFIGKLRRKLETDINSPTLLRTVHRQGYIFTADVNGTSKNPDFESQKPKTSRIRKRRRGRTVSRGAWV
jgi:DNA-binding winged helix-turn-helix (wHTH) protein